MAGTYSIDDVTLRSIDVDLPADSSPARIQLGDDGTFTATNVPTESMYTLPWYLVSGSGNWSIAWDRVNRQWVLALYFSEHEGAATPSPHRFDLVGTESAYALVDWINYDAGLAIVFVKE